MSIRKYTCDLEFFNNEDELSLYWAGFIAADGCILDKEINEVRYLDSLRISLAKRDIEHIIKFADHIKSNSKIKSGITKNGRTYNDSEYSRIDLYSVALCKSLNRFNIVPRKTHIYTFPDWLISHPKVNHFMRGYFDGDGCIRIDKKGNKRFELRGTIPFLTVYRNILIDNCGLKSNKVTMSCNIGRVRYNGNKVCNRIYNFLYYTSSICLVRKEKIFTKAKHEHLLETIPG